MFIPISEHRALSAESDEAYNLYSQRVQEMILRSRIVLGSNFDPIPWERKSSDNEFLRKIHDRVLALEAAISTYVFASLHSRALTFPTFSLGETYIWINS